MLTSVQKEILQTLINLYQSSNGKSIKGEDIAEVMNRNPGTIRNQMQALRSLGLVKGVPGPRGGYKPTIEAYHSLNISVSDNDSIVPIFKNGKKMEGISVARIEFTSVPQPSECEAAIKVLGSIKDLNLGDEVSIGPTPVNNLGVMGTIVGRDDMDNILLVDTNIIRSIPKKTVGELMSTNVVIVNEDLKIANAIDVMLKKSISRLIIADNNQDLLGIVTRTDLIDSITNLKQFPIITN
jgi:predicted transcriptional regulator